MKKATARGRLHPRVAAALVTLVPTALLFLIVAPTPVAFGAAVAAAVSWCRFLDTRPESEGE